MRPSIRPGSECAGSYCLEYLDRDGSCKPLSLFLQVLSTAMHRALQGSIVLNSVAAGVRGPVAFLFNASQFSRNGASLRQEENFAVAIEQPLTSMLLVGSYIALSIRLLVVARSSASALAQKK